MYLAYNDSIIQDKKFPADFWSRLDSLTPFFFYEVFISRSVVPLWEIHTEYFYLIAQQLKLDLPDFFVAYNDILKRLVNRNKFFRGAVVRIIFYPWKNNIEFLAIPHKVSYDRFMCNTERIIVLSSSRTIHTSMSNYIWKVDIHNFIYKNHEESLLVKENKVLNTQNFNILVKKDNTIISPTYKSDATFNALQVKLLDILEQKGFKVKDEPLGLGFISEADELWLVSNSYGVYTRLGMDKFRYYQTDLAQKIVDLVNYLYFSKL